MIKLKSLEAYERIKEKLISLHYKPGQRINVREVSRELEISDIPIREALRMLESEGFIEFEKNKGARVREIDFEEFEELILFRIELEAIAARWATKYISDEEIEILKEKIEKMDKAILQGDSIRYEKENSTFHNYLYSFCNSSVLLETLNNLFARTFYTKSYFSLFPENLIKSNQEHKEIVKYVQERNPKEVENILRKHKQTSIKVILEKFKISGGKYI